jgi:undecaprenyl diphosphate synthase
MTLSCSLYWFEIEEQMISRGVLGIPQSDWEQVLEWCLEIGITTITVYAFSIENFKARLFIVS